MLVSALATSSVEPSRLMARPLGVEPGGMAGKSAVFNRSSTACFAVSITSTMFVFAHATNRRLPSGDSTMSFGWLSVATSRTTPDDARSTSATADAPHSDTHARGCPGWRTTL